MPVLISKPLPEMNTDNPDAPKATVVITTKNRKEDLAIAVASALRQSVPTEVIVIDDGSTDGTADFVRANFPAAKVHRFETSGGLILRRNEGASLASAPVIFSIDDDAEFSTDFVVEQTLADFDHPRIGAVAIPFCDVRKGDLVRQRATHATDHQVINNYIGTAHALRRDVFLHLGGYLPRLIHQGEERDYCLRMLAHGYVVRVGRSDIIKHYESPRRDMTRMTYYGRRNDVLNGWCNVPLPDLLLYWPANTINGLIHGVAVKRIFINIKGIVAGYLSIPAFWKDRRPVPSRIFRLFRRIGGAGTCRLKDIDQLLPPIDVPALAEPGR